jgi:hypothetical protein
VFCVISYFTGAVFFTVNNALLVTCFISINRSTCLCTAVACRTLLFYALCLSAGTQNTAMFLVIVMDLLLLLLLSFLHINSP